MTIRVATWRFENVTLRGSDWSSVEVGAGDGSGVGPGASDETPEADGDGHGTADASIVAALGGTGTDACTWQAASTSASADVTRIRRTVWAGLMIGWGKLEPRSKLVCLALASRVSSTQVVALLTIVS